MRSNSTVRGLFGLLSILAFSSVGLHAQVPETISHQGLIDDPDGNPLEGNVVLTFKIYDVDVDGTALWEEMQGVELENGFFSVDLGSVTPFDTLGFTRPYWIGVTVNAGDELAPRLPLTSTPYSLAAAALADGALAAGSNISLTRNNDNSIVVSATDVGAGDGHSLDASDGDPVDAVFVDEEGRVGIGRQDPSPTAAMSVDGPISFTNRTQQDAVDNPLLYIFETGTNNPTRHVIAHSRNFRRWGLAYNDTTDSFLLTAGGLVTGTFDLASGRLGIRTDEPTSPLTVDGTIESTSDGFKFPDGSEQETSSKFTVNSIGNGNFEAFLNRDEDLTTPEVFGITAPITSNNGFGGMYMETSGEGLASGRPFYGYAHNGAVKAWTDHQGTTNDWRLVIGSNTRFRVNGDTGDAFADGSFNGGGADLAELFEVENDPTSYEPGDVLVISTTSDRRVEQSSEAYSTLVAGVYATKPGVVLSEFGAAEAPDDHVPMGVVGVVPTKVTGEGGPIRRGDLLVTSSTQGHAMKANPDKLGFGMMLGKALENFDRSGSGVIKVLVNVK